MKIKEVEVERKRFANATQITLKGKLLKGLSDKMMLISKSGLISIDDSLAQSYLVGRNISITARIDWKAEDKEELNGEET